MQLGSQNIWTLVHIPVVGTNTNFITALKKVNKAEIILLGVGFFTGE